MTHDEWNASRLPIRGSKGHYESWFLRANHPGEPRALWLRHTFFRPAGNPDDAISALEHHEQRFPGGQLVEDREALLVQALSSAGRDEDARRRAAQFKEKWPRSILMPVVEAATAKKP